MHLSRNASSLVGMDRRLFLATGAALANRDLIYLGVSGDGDSASIGLGQFCHAVRRGVNMTYICENNGVYGLTKGQASPTSRRAARSGPAAPSRPSAAPRRRRPCSTSAAAGARPASSATPSASTMEVHSERSPARGPGPQS